MTRPRVVPYRHPQANPSGLDSRVQVDKGVPLPGKNAHKTKWPWATMVAGDSLFVAGLTQAHMMSLATGWAHRNCPAARFTSRKATEGGQTGTRIWRTA